MFYSLSKSLAFVAEPTTWSVGLLCLAVLLAAARRLAGAALVLVAAASLLGVLSSSLAADALERWIDSSGVETFRPDVTYDALVVLGGDEDGRIGAAAAVIRKGGARNVVYTGRLDARGVKQLAARFRELGLTPDRVELETRSRNTRENAVESARIVAARGWQRIAIVTSAAHVDRARGCFRRVGLDPDTLVVRRRPGVSGAGWPTRTDLRRSSDVLHEAAGRLAYRLVGYVE